MYIPIELIVLFALLAFQIVGRVGIYLERRSPSEDFE